jgi:D-beta-D-heptose 7-phosphate kinase/D-beta-D-heptose 1-phosphate adenosyltransferase
VGPALPRLAESLRGLKVLVIGDAMLDGYLSGTSGRLCPEAPVPVVAVSHSHEAPGGAANVATNAAGLGAGVTLVSVVGDDPEALRLMAALRRLGVDTGGVVADPLRRTLSKRRVMSEGHMLVRFDEGTTSPVGSPGEEAVAGTLVEAFASADAVVVSDYGYGVLTPRVIATLARLQAAGPRLLAVDAKHLVRYARAGVTVVKPNYAQAVSVLAQAPPKAATDPQAPLDRGAPPADRASRVPWMLQQGERLLEGCAADIVAVTLDADGALVFERGRPPHRTHARPHAQMRAAGAGDTYLTAFALGLAAGADTPSAAELASAAAAVVMAKEGTATCSAAEVSEMLAPAGKLLAGDQVAQQMGFHRARGHRIVFTNGCFDILHRGHTTYLNRAKGLGDVLVVGVNTDAGVRRLKGDERPINRLEDRIEVLAALSCVDHVVAFGEDDPSRLIRSVRPDVFVKGGDYTRDLLPEAPVVEELGGTVVVLPYETDRSTTGVIERIRRGAPVPSAPPEPRLLARG